MKFKTMIAKGKPSTFHADKIGGCKMSLLLGGEHYLFPQLCMFIVQKSLPKVSQVFPRRIETYYLNYSKNVS